MRHKLGLICQLLGTVLILASCLWFLHNQIEDDEAGKAAEDIFLKMQDLIPEGTLFHQDVHTDEMTVVEIDGYGYIGYLSIPKLGLELPVMAEWDYERLRIAPCRQFGSTRSRDLVIAGHNYDRHFGRLNQLEYGDLAVFTDMDGVSVLYVLSEIETLQPTQVDELKGGEWDMTLYTCTYGGQSRVVGRFSEMEQSEIGMFIGK